MAHGKLTNFENPPTPEAISFLGEGIKLFRYINARKVCAAHQLSVAEVARRLNKDYVLVRGYICDAPAKRFGENTARQFEEAFGLSPNFLDQSPNSADPSDVKVPTIDDVQLGYVKSLMDEIPSAARKRQVIALLQIVSGDGVTDADVQQLIALSQHLQSVRSVL